MLIWVLLLGCGDEEPSWEEVSGESVVCLSIVEQSDSTQFGGKVTASVMALGMESQTAAHVVDLEDLGNPDRLHIASIGRIGPYLYYCSDPRRGMSRVDLRTGDTETSGTRCSQVTDLDGMLFAQRGSNRIDRFVDWQGVLDDFYAPLSEVRGVSRLGRINDTLLAARHSTDHLEQYDLTAEWQAEMPLDYDGWVMGVGGTWDSLVVLEHQGGNENDWYGRIKVSEFDRNGALRTKWRYGEHLRPRGLSCSGPLDPDTFEPLEEERAIPTDETTSL